MATSQQARPGDALSFPTDHSRLNALFESYKLAAPSLGELAVTSSTLSTPFHLAQLGQHSRLSYQQVADRAKHNHLKAGPDGELLYVDGEGQVVAVQVDPEVSRLSRGALHTGQLKTEQEPLHNRLRHFERTPCCSSRSPRQATGQPSTRTLSPWHPSSGSSMMDKGVSTSCGSRRTPSDGPPDSALRLD